MIENWLTPTTVQADIDGQIGTQLLVYQHPSQSLDGVKAVLLGTSPQIADHIRRQLYPLFGQLPQGQVADLGNAKKNSTEFLIPIFKELIGAGYLVIVLGDTVAGQTALYQAMQQQYPTALQSFIHDRCPAYLLESPFKLGKKAPRSKQLGLIGIQQQLVSKQLYRELLEQEQDLLRLGQIQSNPLIETEPHLRDADYLGVHLSGIRYADAPAQVPLSTPGLSVEAACQLTRYAGTNDKIKAFGTFGCDEKLDDATAHTNALLLYYFLDGWSNRYNEFPIQANKLTEYVVSHRDIGRSLFFMKSERSNRWWLRVAIPGKRRAYRLIPCSYRDYTLATQQQLSPRVLQALEQYS